MDGVIDAAGSSVHVGAVKATKERSDAGACERSDGLDGAGGVRGHAVLVSATHGADLPSGATLVLVVLHGGRWACVAYSRLSRSSRSHDGRVLRPTLATPCGTIMLKRGVALHTR